MSSAHPPHAVDLGERGWEPRESSRSGEPVRAPLPRNRQHIHKGGSARKAVLPLLFTQRSSEGSRRTAVCRSLTASRESPSPLKAAPRRKQARGSLGSSWIAWVSSLMALS